MGKLKIKVVKQDLPVRFSAGGGSFSYDVVVPKGTRVTNKAASGFLPDGEYFVSNLSWIPKEDAMLRHDATFYGIRVKEEDVEEPQCTSKSPSDAT